MGVCKQLDDVPSHHRFRRYRETYEGRDVWDEFEEAKDDAFDSEHFRQSFRKAARTWKEHLASRGRHHALGTPRDIETWCADLVVDRTLDTVYKEYWVRLEEFYRWLQWHPDHPHIYNPALMAAANHEIARAVWWVKMDRNDKALGGVTNER